MDVSEGFLMVSKASSRYVSEVYQSIFMNIRIDLLKDPLNAPETFRSPLKLPETPCNAHEPHLSSLEAPGMLFKYTGTS